MKIDRMYSSINRCSKSKIPWFYSLNKWAWRWPSNFWNQRMHMDETLRLLHPGCSAQRWDFTHTYFHVIIICIIIIARNIISVITSFWVTRYNPMYNSRIFSMEGSGWTRSDMLPLKRSLSKWKVLGSPHLKRKKVSKNVPGESLHLGDRSTNHDFRTGLVA